MNLLVQNNGKIVCIIDIDYRKQSVREIQSHTLESSFEISFSSNQKIPKYPSTQDEKKPDTDSS